jgi:hypothetical protein
MLFDIHVPGKTSPVFNMRTHGDIVFFLGTFQGCSSEIQALFKATKSQALVLIVKTVWPAEHSTGSKGPSIVIIPSVNQGLSGQIFVSGIIVDNGDGAFGPDILIVFGDVILGISDIDVDVAVMMTVYLVIIGDDLTALLGIAGDVGHSNGQLDFQMKFH